MMCMDGSIKGYVAFHSLSVIWYSSRKYAPEQTRRNWLHQICEFFGISSAGNYELSKEAYNTAFRDFEANMQAICAESVGADYIVTVNTKDFEHSNVKAVTPEEFIQIANKF